MTSGERRPFTMPTATGKKARYIDMNAFGSRPVMLIAFSTTMTIGAMAMMGIVCEVMIHGISDLSSAREWTMPTASRMPSSVPRTKPSSVEESVIQAW